MPVITAPLFPILADRQCIDCGRSLVRLTLKTDYGNYLHCEICGRAWHEERSKSEAQSVFPRST